MLMLTQQTNMSNKLGCCVSANMAPYIGTIDHNDALRHSRGRIRHKFHSGAIHHNRDLPCNPIFASPQLFPFPLALKGGSKHHIQRGMYSRLCGSMLSQDDSICTILLEIGLSISKVRAQSVFGTWTQVNIFWIGVHIAVPDAWVHTLARHVEPDAMGSAVPKDSLNVCIGMRFVLDRDWACLLVCV